MATITATDMSIKTIPKFAPGLNNLEEYVGYDMMLYILRYLYNLVLKSKKLGFSKEHLQRQIQKFEEQSKIPGFLSALPIDELLTQLEDAQFFYPIRKREVNFPIFH